jgi:pimeloyl-ACP methyl ester carboxylesterase
MNLPCPPVAACLIPVLLAGAGGWGHVETPQTTEATMQSAHGEVGSIPGVEAAPESAPVADTASRLRMQVERVGSGRPLVLIGGGLTGWASWQPHAERLAPTREVALLQLLSVQYGLEDRPLPDGYSVGTESRALAGALDELGWHRPLDLVAWSYGAKVTLDFALNHPDRVRTLTLIEPPALWVLPEHGRARPDVQELEDVLAGLDDDVDVAALLRFVRTVALVPPGASPESLPQWESWVRHRRSLRPGTAVFRHEDDPKRLRRFAPPVLLVTGDGTSPFLREVHDILAASLPDVRTLELPGGHAPHLVAMDDFLDRLRQFQEMEGGDGGGAPSEDRRVVTSSDGTPVSVWKGGSGPPLLLIHGATADHSTTWRFVRSELEERFTVYAMDRRGRGGSGDGPAYHLTREAEDVAAVLSAIPGPVSVVGHSYGALVAIEAALMAPNLDRLILYEGVPLRGSDLYPPGAIERLEELGQAGDLDGMLTAMFRELVELPPEELELLRSQEDAWEVRLRNAATLPRELGAEGDYVFRPERFRGMTAPTLLLVGGESPPRELANARGVAAGLPDARVVILPGQQHAAMYAAPELFVREVSRFLEAGRR